ncbi:MAG TPA: hypothetical protein ENL09_06495 [Bacteroidetes bacterium]|nr:hypothetical protein [Bacteroidota bacterium]
MQQILGRFKHWKPILFLIIIIVWGIYHYTATERPLGDDARQLVRAWISSEYLSKAMSGQEKSIKEMSDGELEEYGRTLLQLQNVEITSLKARGRGGDVIARAKFLVNGGTPPDSKSVRYFKMKYSPVTGWRMERETSAISYYRKIW